ncbi:mechanosensitive ion channel family protein [Planomicrobium sp. CPCC 101079]|uniref:mechanosensitive ion channel family protein n=1 Tax=Planomicrobium sp. CPCC 101079 TaxID=2599618 RepID=UPI0011B41818|nr:mechanosensitive ion channel family protein [Planomicrobium sp. CPCC 101079]TWT00618.1 mechanosensitive ion channel family protein [Planomicrobium sp. CPCC 101079]
MSTNQTNLGTVTEDLEKATEQTKEVIFNQELWFDVGTVALKVVVIMIAAGIIVRLLKMIVRKSFAVRIKGPLKYNERRQQTLSKLLENVTAYVIYFMAIIAVLSSFNIDVRGLIAGAGVLGLAVGFGAQNLVRDVITGFFIIFEDQFSVGDFVRIGAAEGTVEEIGLRTTKVKGYTGELFIFPNGNITDVVNFSINNSIAVVDVNVAYNADINKVEALIQEFLGTLQDKYEQIIKPPEFLGVQSLTPTEMVVRVVAETLPMQHFAVSRGIRRDLKEFLDANNVEVPLPHMVMMQRQPVDLKK